jgi:hypothetical protein
MKKKPITLMQEKIAKAARELYNIPHAGRWEANTREQVHKYWKNVWLSVADAMLSTPVDDVITIRDLVILWNDGRLGIKEKVTK